MSANVAQRTGSAKEFPPRPVQDLGTVSSGYTKSYWYETSGLHGNAEIPDTFPTLSSDQTADVCVIGGGIAGLTTSYLLANAGKSVVLVEDGLIGSGETGRSTSHIFNALDDRYTYIESKFGKESSRLVAESQTAAIEMIHRIVEAENIQCDFSRLDGYLFAGKNWSEKDLEDEFQAAQNAGIAVRMVDNVPDFKSGKAILFPGQAQFHMNKYLVGLAEACKKKGVKIFTRTHAAEAKGGKDACVTSTDNYKVKCNFIVEATNVPMNDTVSMWTKMKAYRSYAISVKIPKGSVSQTLYWDSEDPYHYVRLSKGSDESHDVMIIGGEDHPTGTEHDFEQRYGSLYSWAKQRFPQIGEVINKWSGQVTEPFDGIAFLGRNPGDYDNVFIITGDSGMGMTNMTLGAMINTDLITGKENPYAKLHSPSRQTLAHDLKQTMMENLKTQAQYKDWLKPSEVKDIEDLKPGCGAVINQGLSKVAVYKDENGNVISRSAVCPHLKAILNWNDSEKTWDCPAHGSRFNACGIPLNGPTNRPLAHVELK